MEGKARSESLRSGVLGQHHSVPANQNPQVENACQAPQRANLHSQGRNTQPYPQTNKKSNRRRRKIAPGSGQAALFSPYKKMADDRKVHNHESSAGAEVDQLGG